VQRGVRDVAPVGGGLQFRRRVFQHGVDAVVALFRATCASAATLVVVPVHKNSNQRNHRGRSICVS
jgi:hypothetical protein